MGMITEIRDLTVLSLLGVLVRTKIIIADDKMTMTALFEQVPASFCKINREQFDSMLRDIRLYYTDRKSECLAEAARRQFAYNATHGQKLITMWQQTNRYADYRSHPIIAFIQATIVDHVEF